MKDFKAKIASIHEDLELRRSLETEEDNTPTFKDQDWILRDVYTSIKNTIKSFDREWYNDNPEADPVNDLMAAFKQVVDQIESRYTGEPRTTFFNAAEDAGENSNFEQEVFDRLSDIEAEIETGEYSQEDVVDQIANQIEQETNQEVTTQQGAVIETKVEEYFAMLNLPHPPHRVSRDALAQRPTEDRHTDSEDIIRGTLQIKGDRMDIGIHDATITVHGVDSPNPMARIRAYLEMALAHILGYSVDAPGSVEGSQFKPLQQPEHSGENPPKVGDYKVSILWADKTGYDSDQFKLTPKTVNAAFARQPRSVR